MILSGEYYIYLHFMDRELRASLGLAGKLADSKVKQWVKIALLMSKFPLYVSLSHMYESYGEFPETIQLLFKLEKFGLVRMATNHLNAEEFLESRQHLYSFDKDRYEQYFSKQILSWPSNVCSDRRETTKYLRTQMLSDSDITTSKIINEEINKSLAIYPNDAITIQRFIPIVQNAAKDDYYTITTDLRVQISRLYTKRYLEIFDGTIITGIDGFSLYDDLAKREFYTDLRLYKILSKAVWQNHKNKDDEEFIRYLFTDHCSQSKTIYHLICDYACALHKAGEPIDAILVILKWQIKNKIDGNDNSFLFNVYNNLKRICKERGINVKMKENVFLIVVATQLELGILHQRLSKDYKVDSIIGNTSCFITSVNENIIYIVKCQMGANGPGGSTLTVDDAINQFNPDAVIMCGIAWGGKPSNQSIGDVLVTTKVWEYDSVKKNEENEVFRGNVTPASANLIQALEMIDIMEQKIIMHFGLVASGSVLLNNRAAVERLKDEQPELIGGEMEAAGVAAICERRSKRWVMIKGICDWGFDKESEMKTEYQQTAANNAVSILIELLRRYNGT